MTINQIQKIVSRLGWNITEVVNGGAKGIDLSGKVWAEHYEIPVKTILPDWSKGKSGGPIRNYKMVKYADGVIAVWDGKSKGTANTIELAKQLRRTLHVVRP
jgi:hypothetical protein